MDKLSKPLFLGALLEKVALFQHSLSLFFLFDQKKQKNTTKHLLAKKDVWEIQKSYYKFCFLALLFNAKKL